VLTKEELRIEKERKTRQQVVANAARKPGKPVEGIKEDQSEIILGIARRILK
jgi:hypothetical protein